MSVFRYDVAGDKTGVNLRRAPKKASTAITENTLLARDSAGRLQPATDTSTNIVGVSMERVTSADSNYAATSDIVYDEPREGDLFVIDVDDTTTSGFVPGVSRALNNAGQVKAAALDGVDDVATVTLVKILSNTSAVFTIKTPSL